EKRLLLFVVMKVSGIMRDVQNLLGLCNGRRRFLITGGQK
ncbi:MAG: hypothetical protein ACI9FG_001691, partial [Crocinitomicaceae bacterium]